MLKRLKKVVEPLILGAMLAIPATGCMAEKSGENHPAISDVSSQTRDGAIDTLDDKDSGVPQQNDSNTEIPTPDAGIHSPDTEMDSGYNNNDATQEPNPDETTDSGPEPNPDATSDN